MHNFPTVAVQLPIYNELFVVERLLHAVAALDYPRDRLWIQILDDSTDSTTELVARTVAALQQQGVNIAHVRRPNREGYKAWALAYMARREELGGGVRRDPGRWGRCDGVPGKRVHALPGAYTIPPGEYEINLVSFVCVGRFGLITVEDGATFVPLPGGGYNFTLDGVALYTNGAIVSPGENVSCNLTNGAGVIHTSNITGAFPGVIGGVLLASDSLLGATLWSYGSEPVFDVATSSLLQIRLNVALSFGSATIGGDGEVYLEADSASLGNNAASAVAVSISSTSLRSNLYSPRRTKFSHSRWA